MRSLRSLRFPNRCFQDKGDAVENFLGMGVSFVPVRALALYGRKRSLTRLSLSERFVRELVVVARKHRKTPEHLTRFVDNVLF